MCAPPCASASSSSPSAPGVGVRGVPTVDVGVASGLSRGDQSSMGSSSSSTYFSGQSRFSSSSSPAVRLSWRVKPRPSPLAWRTIARFARFPSADARREGRRDPACSDDDG